jgi:hypothetical protein
LPKTWKKQKTKKQIEKTKKKKYSTAIRSDRDYYVDVDCMNSDIASDAAIDATLPPPKSVDITTPSALIDEFCVHCCDDGR